MSQEGENVGTSLLDRLKAAFPELEIREYMFISSGWDNYAVLVNEEILFKIPRSREHVAQLRKEIEVLRCLEDSPVRLPSYIMVSTTANSEMGGYRYIPGLPLNTVESLTQDMKTQLTEFLNYMFDHRDDPCLLNSIGTGTIDDWISKYSELMEQAYSSFLDVLDDYVLSNLARKFSNFVETLSRTISISPVHADLYKKNVLINESLDGIAAILDWGDAQMGDPAIDFAALSVDFGMVGIEEILGGYSGIIDENFRQRMEFYWQVEPIYGMLFFRNRNDLLFESNLKELVRRLDSELL